MMDRIQQNEQLQYIGKLLRRAKGSAEYEVVEDLSPYLIDLRLNLSSSTLHAFDTYKSEGVFYTSVVNTMSLPTGKTLYLQAAVAVEGVMLASVNTLRLQVAKNITGAALADLSELPDYGDPSPTEGSIESGEWEYLLKLVRAGGSVALNTWCDSSEVAAFALGTLLKGEQGDPYVLTAQDKTDIAAEAAEMVEVTGSAWVRGSLYLATTSTTNASLNYYLGGDDNIAKIIEVIDNLGVIMLNNAMESDAYVSAIEYVTYNWSETSRKVGFKIPLESANNQREVRVNMTDVANLSVYGVVDSALSITKTSELTNDSGFTTLAKVLEQVYNKTEIAALIPAMETISNISDFNDYTSVGYYGVVTQISGTLNAPEEGYHNWALEVILKSARVVMQRATRLGDNDQLITYMREVNHVDSLYTTWQRVVDAQYMETYVGEQIGEIDTILDSIISTQEMI